MTCRLVHLLINIHRSCCGFMLWFQLIKIMLLLGPFVWYMVMYTIKPTVVSRRRGVAGTHSGGPESPSRFWLRDPGCFGAKLGRGCSRAVVAVLDVPGPPDFAGTLAGSMPARVGRFWDISGTLRGLFIFGRSVRSGSLGPHFGLPNVRSSSHCACQPWSANGVRRSTFWGPRIAVPVLAP